MVERAQIVGLGAQQAALHLDDRAEVLLAALELGDQALSLESCDEGLPCFEVGRLVDNPMYTTRYGDGWMMQVAGDFTALASDVGVHPVSLAVAWVMAHPGVTAPILGGLDLAQLRPALDALDVEMTPELYARISALSPEPPPATDRNEERAGLKPFAPR